MRAVDLIRHKRDGGMLDPDDIREFVAGVTDGRWADYQVAAMLMAIAIRGLTLEETVALTDAMIASGATLDLSDAGGRPGVPVDKHSTGGVGDKASLVLAPLAAACGAVVPMMSGRGLGHTGGTLDKLEAIPGFRTDLSLAEARRVLDRVGCVLIGQTAEIAPADRRLYALRDVTGTVESIPLICASILSKKIAEGIGALVLDVKVGRGAFMATRDEARRLGEWLIGVAGRHGVVAEAVLTPMDAPLGRAVGNANEVVEALETLKGRGPADLEALSVRLAAMMLRLAGLEGDDAAAEARVRAALESGRGLETFRAIVEAQGGDPRVIDDCDRLPRAALVADVTAGVPGVVQALDAATIGRAAVVLGAGRDRVDDRVRPGVGLEVLAPIGTAVGAGDAVLRLTADDAARLEAAVRLVTGAIRVGPGAPAPVPTVLESLRPPALAG
ncbi:MAG: thymidine phosphorylase [Vicinamibacterales bacterium]